MTGRESPRIQPVKRSSAAVSACDDASDDGGGAVPSVSVNGPTLLRSEHDSLLKAFEARMNAQLRAVEARMAVFAAENEALRKQLAANVAPVMGPPTSATSPRAPRKVARKAAGERMSCSDSEGADGGEFPALPAPRWAVVGSGRGSVGSVGSGFVNRLTLSGRGGARSAGNSSGSSVAGSGSGSGRGSGSAGDSGSGSANGRGSGSGNGNGSGSVSGNGNGSGSVSGNGNGNGSGSGNGRKKILQALDTSLFAVKQQLTEANVTSFVVKQATRGGPVRVTIANEGEVAVAKAALAAGSISYHEFKWADEKRKCFVIRGLVGAGIDELPEIRQDLLEAGLPEDIEVALHVTGFMRARPNEQHNMPVKVIVPASFDVKMLSGIRSLNHIAVRFEAFKSNDVLQCKNCQRFGHSSAGCQHAHRCVKCGLNHLRDACPRTHSAAHKLKCCNCGGEHTANDVNNCPFFKQRFGNRQQKAAAKVAPARPVTRPAPAPRQAGVSFAQAAGGSSSGADGSRGSSFSNGGVRSGSGFSSGGASGGVSGCGGSGCGGCGCGGVSSNGAAVFHGQTLDHVLTGFMSRMDRLEHMVEQLISKLNNV